MKKKFIIFISMFIILIFLFLVIPIGVDQYDNYTGMRGTKETGRLVNGLIPAYNNNIFIGLNTIAENDEYGSFIFKEDGKFYYFPGRKNILDNRYNNAYQYMGYWYYDYTHNIQLKVFRTYFNKILRKANFKEKQYILPFDYINSEEYKFSDDLLIDNKIFKLLDNELTEKSGEKLRLDEEIINQYLFSK